MRLRFEAAASRVTVFGGREGLGLKRLTADGQHSKKMPDARVFLDFVRF